MQFKFMKGFLLAIVTTLLVSTQAFAAMPADDVAAWPDDVTNPIVETGEFLVTMDAVPVGPQDLMMENTALITPITIIDTAQSERLVFETFTYAGQVFGALLSIIAMGAGISLGFRIAREVRGFLSGG